MKRLFRITVILILLVTVTVVAQPKTEWGPKFDYNVKIEQDPKIVLADNYNHYSHRP